jgi:hypothetical protein
MSITTNQWSGARFSASSRPIPPSLRRRGGVAPARSHGRSRESARLTRTTLVALPLLAAAALIASAPRSVTIPIALALAAGVGAGGLVADHDARDQDGASRRTGGAR